MRDLFQIWSLCHYCKEDLFQSNLKPLGNIKAAHYLIQSVSQLLNSNHSNDRSNSSTNEVLTLREPRTALWCCTLQHFLFEDRLFLLLSVVIGNCF